MRKAQINPIARTRLLDAAQSLILKKGFSSTTVDEICRTAKLTKGTFFHDFKSKEDLGKVVLERFCCHSRESMRKMCCSGDESLDPLKKVYNHLDCAVGMARTPATSKGCLLGVIAQEMSDTYPAIRELCKDGFEEWAKLLKKDLDEAKAKYAPRAAFDTRSLAEYFIAIVEGSQILSRAKPNHKFMENNMEHFKQYLKILFKK